MLLLGTPAWGQSAEEIQKLIAELGEKDKAVRRKAAQTLGEIGPKAAPAVPALIAALDEKEEVPWDGIESVRWSAGRALGEIGPLAVPALAAALSDGTAATRSMAARALLEIGTSLKKKGIVLWWVVPRAFWKELVGLVLLLAAWFALVARFPKQRPTSAPKHLALMALTAAVPVGLSCSAVYYAITREWAQGFLPDAMTVVPFPVAAVLSMALVCVLPAVWVCQRKSYASTDVGAPRP